MNQKKILPVMIILLLLFTKPGRAQIWDTLSTGVSTDLKDLQFVNKDTGYAVGSKGGIIKTTNGGQTWIQQNSGVTNTLRGVYFITPSYGFACADSGRILRTLNGGQTWIQQNAGTSNNLIDVHFATARMGLIVGTGKVLFTNDSGNTWQTKNAAQLGSITLRSVTYTTLSTAWACGDPRSGAQGLLYHSLDSGKTWTSLSNTSAPNGKAFNKVLFTTPLSGWLLGQTGIIVHTTDSGKSGWSTQFSGTSFDFLGADQINGSLFAVGRNGIVAFSNNAGTNWSSQYSSTSKQLWSVDFVNDSTGWACGDSGTVIRYKKIVQTKPIMLLQPNGGETWLIGKKYNIIWYAPGISTLVIDYSLNNGQSWTTLANNVSAQSNSYAWSLNTPPSLQCMVRLRNSNNLSVGDTSDANFTIINTPVGADYSVMLSATVQTTPAKIQLTWENDPNANSYTIYRKLKTDTTWTQLTIVSGNTLNYSDSLVSIATIYEYKVSKTTPLLTGTGYLYSGINLPAIENRGTVLVLIDSSFNTYLSAEIKQYEADLVGDGWKVIRKLFPPSAKDTVVKNFITQQYNASAANVKSVVLIGNIPIPYSGNFAPDGHAERVGAQPCDAYYADVNGNWTDNSTLTTNSGNIYTPNTPGDGKWDQSTIPSEVELQVGRIDMHNLPLFNITEKDLLKHYLNKNHRFRHKQINVASKSLLFTRADVGLPNISAGGWRSQAPMFGFNNLRNISACSNTNCTDLIDSLKTNSYLWTYAGDGGTDTSFGGSTFTSTHCVQDSIKSVFMQVWGSYFVEWGKGSFHLQNNLLRSIVANKGYTLASVWTGRFPYWYFHPMSMGENIGACTQFNQNNTRGLYEAGQPSLVAGSHMALMGDPTLRLQMVAPIPSIQTQTVSGKIQITWTASTDANAGYYVYRATSILGTFSRINNTALTATSFTDSFPLNGNNVYMIRALRLETSASGTYYNLSQGIFDSVTYSGPSTNFTITASSSMGGSISPTGTITAAQGSTVKFTITPSTGYHLDSLLINGQAVTPDTTYSFVNLQTSHTIRAVFAINTYTISASASANGSITPSGNVSVTYLSNQQFVFYAASTYMVDSVWVDQAYAGNMTSYTFNQVVANHTVAVSFKKTPLPVYNILATATTGGSISPSGNMQVTQGDNQSFNVTPNAGFVIDSVMVDGISLGLVTTYSFSNVQAPHTIHAAFKAQVNSIAQKPDIADCILLPNPAILYTELWCDKRLQEVVVYNAQGIAVETFDSGNLQTINMNIASWPAGTYTLRLKESGERTSFKRLVVLH